MLSFQTFVLYGTRGGPIRHRILGALEVETHTVEELAALLGDSPRTLREHLAVLEANNMVNAHKRPDDTKYVLTDEALVLLK
ncbi:winged helix-turn-helix domain-containing protein [Halogranum rubrum]|uniref:winged helix-turn-helix domain-containing protein n=1 Tax=Halogranum rubrum TaxID=553466 RepID=UPI0006778844|nr:winged helix-turn-helix domain-containing protein [Halogranum salarium]